MKTKELKDLRNKKTADLKKMVEEKRKELSLFYSKMKAGKEKNTSKFGSLKKDIAQILSVVSEMEIIEKLSGKEEK